MPMFVIMAGISVNEINYEAYNVRVKQEYVKADVLEELHNNFFNHMSKMELLAPEEDNTYKNFFVFDYWLKEDAEHFKNNGK